jgi:hypothetical protein
MELVIKMFCRSKKIVTALLWQLFRESSMACIVDIAKSSAKYFPRLLFKPPIIIDEWHFLVIFTAPKKEKRNKLEIDDPLA